MNQKKYKYIVNTFYIKDEKLKPVQLRGEVRVTLGEDPIQKLIDTNTIYNGGYEFLELKEIDSEKEFNENELVQYFLINKDIKMRKGKIASQVAHAACIYTYQMMDSRRYLEKSGNSSIDNFLKWYHHMQKKIVLKAPQSLLEQLEAKGYVSIRDKGYTQIDPDSLTVVTLGVVKRNSVSDIVGDLALL